MAERKGGKIKNKIKKKEEKTCSRHRLADFARAVISKIGNICI